MVVTRKLLICFALGTLMSSFTEPVQADHEAQMLRHARQLRLLARDLGNAFHTQLAPSPFSTRMCQYAERLDQYACRMEELILMDRCGGLQHQITMADRMVCNLVRLMDQVDRRVARGYDPYMGCTLHIHRKLASAGETVRCLQDLVGRGYSPVSTGYDFYQPPQQWLPPSYSNRSSCSSWPRY